MKGEIDAQAADRLRGIGALETSLVSLDDGSTLGVRPGPDWWEVLAWTPSGVKAPAGIAGETRPLGAGSLVTAAATPDNAAALRHLVPWLRPRPLGDVTSVGLGDRLGMATPAHVEALFASPGVAPVLAQQSARELSRTGRTFGDVVDAATFGALASGWREGYGADGDHLKTIEQLDAALEAGCTMITADPIELVPNLPADAPRDALAAAFERVPWASLEDDPKAFASRYPEALALDGQQLPLPREALAAAAARFGAAVVQVATMYRHLRDASDGREVEFEVAVDEIDHPTTGVDHVYLATELHRLGVAWVSFAPRFVGRFEKGVDYIGDPGAYEADVSLHAAIARALGPYKLSVHSGSDKFSIYEATLRETRGLVHLKTSGTSYLEALHTLALTEPELLRRVWRVALDSYKTARASYHVSADVTEEENAADLPDAALVRLFEDPDKREILHVSFGAVLGGSAGAQQGQAAGQLAREVRGAVWAHRGDYWSLLAEHIKRHLAPFSAGSNAAPGAGTRARR
jgi:tagaturonate epimerase